MKKKVIVELRLYRKYWFVLTPTYGGRIRFHILFEISISLILAHIISSVTIYIPNKNERR